MKIFKKDPDVTIHPYVPELKNLFKKGEITRRDFLRNATLLGMSVAAAASFVSPLGMGKALAAETPKRGGIWKCAMGIKRIDHPARLSWAEGANIVRQISEYLTFTGDDNITTPQLLEKWAPSEDLKTWDLYLRKGILFNNGDEFKADDVMFTMKEWLTKDVGSSMLGLLSYWGGYQNVEKVNDYHIRLHLAEANIGVPEHLFHYPGIMLHRDFEGDIIKQPVGTGPYELKEFRDGERAVFTARKDYWQKGFDGKPLPYMDSIVYLDMAKDAAMAALSAGQVDALFKPRPADLMTAKGLRDVKTYGVDTGGTYLTRMRVDQAPWDDNRMRTALKLCQDREKIRRLAAMGVGILGIDAHVSPVHPEWCEKPRPDYNPQKALELVKAYAAEKGLKLPIKVTLATKNDTHEPEIAQALKELSRPAGIDIQLDITEASKYWSRWTEVPLGITSWQHRPLGVMVLPLAYTKAAIGAWNETRWHDDEFDKYLTEAQKTLDPKERSKVMCKIEDIMQERGPVAISYFYNVHVVCHKKFKNVTAHPSFYHTFTNDMWVES
jgi:peptide/nickel transport system substrate-binding protein